MGHIQLFDLFSLLVALAFIKWQIWAVCSMSVYPSRDTATTTYFLLSAQTKVNYFPFECITFEANNSIL